MESAKAADLLDGITLFALQQLLCPIETAKVEKIVKRAIRKGPQIPIEF